MSCFSFSFFGGGATRESKSRSKSPEPADFSVSSSRSSRQQTHSHHRDTSVYGSRSTTSVTLSGTGSTVTSVSSAYTTRTSSAHSSASSASSSCSSARQPSDCEPSRSHAHPHHQTYEEIAVPVHRISITRRSSKKSVSTPTFASIPSPHSFHPAAFNLATQTHTSSADNMNDDGEGEEVQIQLAIDFDELEKRFLLPASTLLRIKEDFLSRAFHYSVETSRYVLTSMHFCSLMESLLNGNQFIASRLFHLFNREDSHGIVFDELLTILHMMDSKRPDSDKLLLSFRICDMYGRDCVSEKELTYLLMSLLQQQGVVLNQEEMRQVVQNTLKLGDQNQSGALEFDEFCQLIRSQPAFLRLFSIDIDTIYALTKEESDLHHALIQADSGGCSPIPSLQASNLGSPSVSSFSATSVSTMPFSTVLSPASESLSLGSTPLFSAIASPSHTAPAHHQPVHPSVSVSNRILDQQLEQERAQKERDEDEDDDDIEFSVDFSDDGSNTTFDQSVSRSHSNVSDEIDQLSQCMSTVMDNQSQITDKLSDIASDRASRGSPAFMYASHHYLDDMSIQQMEL